MLNDGVGRVCNFDVVILFIWFSSRLFLERNVLANYNSIEELGWGKKIWNN